MNIFHRSEPRAPDPKTGSSSLEVGEAAGVLAQGVEDRLVVVPAVGAGLPAAAHTLHTGSNGSKKSFFMPIRRGGGGLGLGSSSETRRHCLPPLLTLQPSFRLLSNKGISKAELGFHEQNHTEGAPAAGVRP